MFINNLKIPVKPLPGPVPAWHTRVELSRLADICTEARNQGGRLCALWGADERDRGAGFSLHLVLANDDGALWITCPLDAGKPLIPDIAKWFACADRQQRALHDLLGIAVEPAATEADRRPWLRHGAWSAAEFPLRLDAALSQSSPPGADGYRFVPVEGDGVHEIPVGPVHAGIIEPGHFRFSVVGEKVLRLEERLGYTHKGIDKRFSTLNLKGGMRLAARVSGDSTVAYSWAYAMAVETLTASTPPARSQWLRALFLERERLANHLGDLAYLGNDGGLAFGFSQFMRLKEDVLRTNASVAGHRYLMDLIIPGGVMRDIDRKALDDIAAQCDVLSAEVRTLRNIYDEHAGLQDRFMTCGILDAATAKTLGVVGLAARASGIALDARHAPGLPPYDLLDVKPVIASAGDVAARVAVRFGEIGESLRLIRAIVERIAPGGICIELPVPPTGAIGLGWIEGWRGEVFMAIEAGENGRIRRAHAHDPSWQNWPALEHAVIGNIVPDFPLINKSFNLSYSGQDL
jgi:Ni,Fe-hydrogenase III large subunit/Ni,Fe-hydrogenase III component G